MTVTPPETRSAVVLRPATLDDAAIMHRWDRDPAVIACSSDNPEAEVAFEGADWAEEIAAATPLSFHLIAEERGRPVGALQIVDPHLEPTAYWGAIEPDLRAIDVWIGDPADRNRGLGAEIMRQAIELCFAAPAVAAIVIDPLASNTAAHRFYRRLGFEPVGRRLFGTDDCLVHRLERAVWTVRRAAPEIAA
jgi:aminoglycoside 6'-N-acetyltransferase